jgi:hypothetical protein
MFFFSWVCFCWVETILRVVVAKKKRGWIPGSEIQDLLMSVEASTFCSIPILMIEGKSNGIH